MHDTAQRKFESAHSWAWRVGILVSLVVAAAAQTPRWSELDVIAVKALDAKEPTTRGEAALWLAESQSTAHYRAMTSLARDPQPEARHRAIAALGRLAAPGAEAFLAKLALADADPGDALVATFALGQLDHQTPAPAIDALLQRTQGASMRRNADLLAALLGGLAAGGARGRATALLALRDSESNRIASLRELAHATLTSGELTEVTRELAERWLQRNDPTFRRLALQHWQGKWPLSASVHEHVRRLTRNDPSPEVRAAGLELLARQLDGSAIDLAQRALLSTHAVEASAAARTLLRLAGVARQPSIEDRALNDHVAADVRIALLEVLGGTLQPKTLLGLHDLVNLESAADALRVTAALALARTDSSLAVPALRTTFRDLPNPGDLTAVARALADRELLEAEIERLAVDRDAPGSASFGPQLHAIAGSDGAAACALTQRLYASGRLGEREVGSALAALRRVRAQRTATLRARLPEVIRRLDL